MATNAFASQCLSCAVPLVPGTGYCGTCGTPVGQTGRFRAAAPPVLPLVDLTADAPASGTMLLRDAPDRATARIERGLVSLGCTITGRASSSLTFMRPWRRFYTLALSTRYYGRIEVTPGENGGSVLRLALKFESASFIKVALIVLPILLAASLYGNLANQPPVTDAAEHSGKMVGMIGAPFAVLALIWWRLRLGGARKRLAEIVQAIRGAAPTALPDSGVPMPVPSAPVAPPPLAGAAPAPSAVEQLRTLADLHGQGVLTPAEFNAAKAALLAKLT